MKDPTITHNYLIALFRESKNGPVAKTKENHRKLVAKFEAGINEAAGINDWALDMLEALNTLVDPKTGNARVCPPEVQPYLDYALANARVEEAARNQAIKNQVASRTLQTVDV